MRLLSCNYRTSQKTYIKVLISMMNHNEIKLINATIQFNIKIFNRLFDLFFLEKKITEI